MPLRNHRSDRPRERWHIEICRAFVIAIFIAMSATGCVSNSYLTVRPKPRNPLTDSLNLFASSDPKPTFRTTQLLRRYDLAKEQQQNSPVVLVNLEQEIAQEPSPDKIYSYAEVAYLDGTRALVAGQEAIAMDLFSAAVAHAYLYLFDPNLEPTRNMYDPQFRQACDVYNNALEACLRILKKNGKLGPGASHTCRTAQHEFELAIEVRGPWHPEDFERLEFVSDFEVHGLTNKYHTYGLGVPLIAVRKQHPHATPAEKYYPDGLTFPVTAFLRVQRPSREVATTAGLQHGMRCVLELHDPLFSDHLEVCNRQVPLETDLSTPLGYSLDSPNFTVGKVATLGLLSPSKTQKLEGIYMVEPYSPHKIPVLMVHGLWSSPTTWMEMFNDLRALPEVRNRFQFWFYLYPTGQPFWVSAARLREDLVEIKRQLNPRDESPAFNQMVLVGHSMGGLVSSLQTVDSGDDYWRILSERAFEDLKTDPETRARLSRALYFHPNPSIKRVVTLATPHRGSDFANEYTRWLGRSLITLPAKMVQTSQKLIRDNPGFFRDTNLLTITTSIDSLSPDSPIFPVLRRSPRAPWVKYHNIVGLLPKSGVLLHFSGVGDGIVSFTSAHLDEVESEVVVSADHVNVHTHPRSVLEVRRILLEHLHDLDATAASANSSAEPGRLQVQSPVSRVDFETKQNPIVDRQVTPAGHTAAETCHCEGCRKKELPKFDYGAIGGMPQ